MILLPLIFSLAVLESPYRPVPPVGPASVGKFQCAKGTRVMNKRQGGAASDAGGVANLPHSFGKRFASLDEYLTHLKCAAGPIDLPWWREIRPGVYQRMTTATNARRETATRAELLERFGFSR